MAGSVAPTVVSEAVSEVNSNLNALTEAFRKNKEQCIQLDKERKTQSCFQHNATTLFA